MKRDTTRALTGILLLGTALCTTPAAADYAEDRAEIEDLQARYMFALDFRDAEAYAETFAPDGVLDYGAGKIAGREAIADMVTDMRAGEDEARAADDSGMYPATGRHNITNIVIDVDGDTATSYAYWFHYGNDNPERAAQINSYGYYEDELVRIDGEWLFTLRKIYNEQVEAWIGSLDNPVGNPGAGPGAGG